MADRLFAQPVFLPKSLPPQLERGGVGEDLQNINSFTESYPASEADVDWLAEEDWLLKGEQRTRYGPEGDDLEDAAVTVPMRERISRRKMRGRRRQHYGRRLESTTISSLTRIFTSNESSDDENEEPPIIKMIYRRSGKDLAKLIILPVLYFSLMILATVFAFYTIEGLIQSYNNKVRSVQSIEVKGRYPPIGIAIMPKFAEYNYCEYRYYDDVSPHPERPPEMCYKYEIPFSCLHYNVSFNSTALKHVERFAMVFRGPTLVDCKESILLHYVMNVTMREFSAVEYILFENWAHFESLNEVGRREFLASLERDSNIYTFPAGFRTWVKMSYSVRYDYNSKHNKTDFSIIDNYAAYNDPGIDGMFPLEIVFEWKSRYYDFITEIVSTTAWSAFGSICGVFITLVKAGDFGRMWVKRIRREKQKKMIHLKKLEEEQEKQLEEYRDRQRERRETKLKKSIEASKSVLVQIKPFND